MTIDVDTVPNPRRMAHHHGVTGFIRHYVEMVAAMFLGMILYPAWELVARHGPDWTRLPEVESLVMATAMSIPMVALMAYRGHRPRLTVEMVAAMYAGFVLLFPFLWSGAIDAGGLWTGGHVLMPTFMLGAMLLRRREYMHAVSTRVIEWRDLHKEGTHDG